MPHQKPFLDWLHLPVVSLQLIGMLALDLLPLYPAPLWAHADHSPLHFLVRLRAAYVSRTGDPFFPPVITTTSFTTITTPTATSTSTSAAHDRPWFRVFLYIEALVQLPLAVYFVYHLVATAVASSSSVCIPGTAELAGLALACLSFMGASACSFELLHMAKAQTQAQAQHKGDAAATAGAGNSSLLLPLYGIYLPFVIASAVLAVDMYQRLLRRLRTTVKNKDE